MASRIWILVMALAIGIALTGTFLHQSAAKRTRDFALLDQLRRDRVETELWLRIDARKRLDALAPIATQPELRSALRRSSGKRGVTDPGTRRQLKRQLATLNTALKEGRGELMMALDAEGEVVADIRGNPDQVYSLEKMPLFRDAIRGFVRDDVWYFNGALYRMAARPVIDGGRYVGAILHGIEFNQELAKRISDRIDGAGLAFFVGQDIFVSQRARNAGRHAVDHAEALTELWKTKPPTGDDSPKPARLGEMHGAIASFLTGSAAHANAGYLITRTADEAVTGLFAGATKEDLSELPWALTIGIPFFLGLLGLLLLYVERDRPLYGLAAASKDLVDKKIDGLPVDILRGRFRVLADRINTALQQGIGVSHERMSRRGIELDEILASSGESSSEGFFGFSNGGANSGSDVKTVDQVATSPPEYVEHNDFDEDDEHDDFDEDDEHDDFDDSPTMVTEVPKELLNEVQTGAKEEQHFREVFDQFVATEKQCGGKTEGLTFHNFARKLRATRDDLKERHHATGVRFTVYVKDGRAALRASPLHD